MSCGKSLRLKGLYEANALIGQGGMGRTFRAKDWGRMGQPCAIKQFLPQWSEPALIKKAIALFEREAEQLQLLGSHPQIPELISYFEEDGYLYLVQELIEGENLYVELQCQGIFSETKISQLLTNLLPVLQFIHEHQVIHRDIKPENIIRRAGINPLSQGRHGARAEGDLVLVDFGAAKEITHNTAGRTGTLIGSAEYIAPEQARGKAVTQSDLYSLGVTCLYLLTGISPFDLYDDHSDRWIWQTKLQTPISEHLAQILNRLIEPAIANRYASAKAVLEDLQAHRQGTKSQQMKQLAFHDAPQIDELREVLNLGQWQAGDRLTNQIILALVKKERIAQLTTADIEKIPCEVWLAIDQLWMQATNCRFGWSAQQQIWQSLNGRLIYGEDTYWEFAKVYEKFADRVGWRKSIWLNLPFLPKVWRKYENLTFAIAAPQGHLPSLFFWEGFNLVDSVFYRLEICRKK